jgi:peptide/nickel transport system substrate-binding protein
MNGFPQNLTSYGKQISSGIKELKHLSLSRLRKVFSLMGKNEKIALLTLLALAVISLFISLRNIYYIHTVPAPDFGGSYSEGLTGQPTYINPLLATMDPDLSLTNLVFSGLYKYDSNGLLAPDLADGMPQISDDQKQYTINLKHNVKWQNGKPLTADDVVFTVQLLQDPDYKSPLWPLWQATTVTKLSDYSVQFTTKDISGPFINNLTLPILPKSIWSGVDAQNFLLSKYNLEAIGSGPYAVKQIKKLPSGKIEEIDMQANADYYGGRPKIDNLVFKFYDDQDDILNAFHSREIDGFGYMPLGNNLSLDDSQPRTHILTVPLPQYQIAFFNLNNPILKDINVRQALSLATDRQQIIDQVFGGNAYLPVSPWLGQKQPAAAPTVDLSKAKNLLDADGWKINSSTDLRTNKQGQTLQFTISTNDSLVDSNAAQVLAGQWKKLNITVNLSILPGSQLSDTLIKPRAFDVLLFPQKFGADPDPFPFWHSSQVKDPGFNLTGFSSPAADKLIIDARTTTDTAAQQKDYQQFNDLIMSQFPVIFLDQTEYVYATDSSVKNIQLNILYDPSQRFNGIGQWYMETKRVWK